MALAGIEGEGELAQSIAILCVVRARTESRTRIKYGLYFVCQHMRLERALALELELRVQLALGARHRLATGHGHIN